MKQTIIAIMLTAISATAAADDKCENLHKIGESVMKIRQNGVSLVKALDAMKTENPKLTEFLREVVVIAYKKPRYQTEKMQQREITKFADSLMLECLK